MQVIRLKTNRLVNPLGFQLDTPRLSWVVEGAKGRRQKWARVAVSTQMSMQPLLFDTGESAEASNLGVAVPLALKPRTRYYWQVTVCSDLDEIAQSAVSWFETGKLDEPFAGRFITTDLPGSICPYLRKSFYLDKKPDNARAYFTGLGIYELYINGQKVGDELLAPGCTAYDKWLQYQSYDVTGLLAPGENTLLAILGNGWAKGRFGFDGQPGSFEEGTPGSPSGIFVDDCMLMGELIVKTDGEEQVIPTDESWQSAASPLTFSSIYDGECYDARITPEKASWTGTRLVQNPPQGALTARLSLPVRVVKTFKPRLFTTPKGEQVLDVGQVISGFVAFNCAQTAGTQLRLSYGELLQDDCFYRDNMRSALCEYRFIAGGDKAFARPISTFYGFRYVKLEGWKGTICAEDFTAWAICSDLEETGKIETANEKVNRLFQNCLWSQRDNFVDVPTDCPQRDERMGWTGDAQVFCPTANFNMDCLAFYTKFGKDLMLDQMAAGGRVPHVVPVIAKGDCMLTREGGACGWADAAAVVPWVTYVFSGDKAILEAQFDSMRGWADWIYRHDCDHGGTGLWQETTMHFGDWLALDGARSSFDPEYSFGGTDNTFLCSAYYYYSTLLVAKAARVLGKAEVADAYFARAEKTLGAIRHEFYTPGGLCAAATQTGQALSLHFGLAPEAARPKILQKLRRLLQDNDMHLKTGFLGTPILCRALSDNGAGADAYTLFLQEDLPSWLYEVDMGATTIWERWNSVLPDGKISGIGMNSMNHYAYGAVIEWVYRNVCGINPSEEVPGFKRFTLRPQPDRRLGAAKASVMTAAGFIESGWQYDASGNITYTFTVPFDTVADLCLPVAGLKNCCLCGMPLSPEGEELKLELTAGTYLID